MPSPPTFEPDPDEFDSHGSFSIEGEFDDPERILKHALALAEPGYATPMTISEQLLLYLESGLDPAEAVGKLHIATGDLPHWSFGSISNVLSDREAARLYVYRELSDRADYRIDSLLDDESFREKLRLRTDVSEKTITRIAETINEDHGGDVVPQLESVARQLQDEDVADDLLDPPEPATDGMDAPPLVKHTRAVKTTAYSCIKLGREGPTQYDKWELFKPFELAAKDNIHLNDARACLEQKPHYWNRKTPTAKATWNQMREFSRGQFRLMFLCAFEQFLDVLDRHDLLPECPEVAIDLTGWPWYGETDDKETEDGDQRQPVGVEGTKPGRNYSHSWQFATASLVRCEVPMTFAARSVEKRNRRHYHVHHLLNYAEAKFDVGRVYLDKDFYAEPVKDELEGRDVGFIIAAPRHMGAFEDLIMGTELREDSWNAQRYEIGVGADESADHWLVVNPSEKRLKRADTGLEDTKNWEAYYTNINPETVDGGGAQLAADYRLRWAIETAYRMLKHNFMPKSGTPLRNQRVFLFNLAVLFNNMWLTANVFEAERQGTAVKDSKGNYSFTANQFMTALLDDFEPVEIGEVGDLSEKSDIVKLASELDTTL